MEGNPYSLASSVIKHKTNCHFMTASSTFLSQLEHSVEIDLIGSRNMCTYICSKLHFIDYVSVNMNV
jgi:hypothetical protein